MVVSGVSLIQRCYSGVLEELPEELAVEIAHPRAIARDALRAKRFEEARIRNPRCIDKLFMAINRGACIPTPAQAAVGVSVACVSTYGYCSVKAYGEGAGFQEAFVV